MIGQPTLIGHSIANDHRRYVVRQLRRPLVNLRSVPGVPCMLPSPQRLFSTRQLSSPARSRFLAITLGIVFCAVTSAALSVARAGEDEDFFEAKVRPLLHARCLNCHRDAKSGGGLSLESRRAWEQGGESGPVIVPGRPEDSLLWRAVSGAESGLQMPPKSAGGKLADSELAILREWILRGAPDPRIPAAKLGGLTRAEAESWWAFQPLTVPELPPAGSSPNGKPSSHPIDRFCDAAIQAQHLSPALPADRRTLIRRVTYDLIGLPPTPQEVDAFLADDAPDAYLRVVDRLLASPHYGEHWGRHWLDVVRYADTAGENTDRPLPHIWRYRNWVFDALNRDLPYDEFIRQQLAGDILGASQSGPAHADGIVATGYLAVARRFGHDSDTENHLMYEDVIDNLGKTFLGLTLACTRCHDHKYDPLTMHDYYGLYGIFASSKFSFSGCEAKGQPRDLVTMLTPSEVDQARQDWETRRATAYPDLAHLERQIDQVRSGLANRFRTSARPIAAADVPEATTVPFTGATPESLNRIEVRAGEVLLLSVSPQASHGADTTRVEWEIAEVDGARRTWNVQELIPDLLAGNPHLDQATKTPTWCFLDLREAPLLLVDQVQSISGRNELKAWHRTDVPSVYVNTSPQPVQVYTELPPTAFFVHPGPNGAVGVAWISPITGTVSINGRVGDAHPAGGDGVAYRVEHLADTELGDNLRRLGTLQQDATGLIRRRDAEFGTGPTIPIAFAVMEGTVGDIPLHQRGDPERPGPVVPRGWPQVLGGGTLQEPTQSGRRELADWIAAHPLTARVLVNRVWQRHFGAGLVRTPNDFGTRGERPTHPELLEWLAATFVNQGRQWKPLHRLIVTSATYQRSSAASTADREHDPENRWLGRMSRRRLTAEELRDSLLTMSGNLDLTPATNHPFPPENTWSFSQHNPFSAVYDNPHRTAYQMVQRQRRHPFLALFDGADPNASTAVRQTTTVPTQALFFLNDPFFHEQARGCAARLSGDGPTKIEAAFARIFQRVPTAKERALAKQFLAEYPGTDEERWAAYIRVLLSSNEFLTLD